MLTDADAAKVAKAILNSPIPSAVDGKPHTVAWYIAQIDKTTYLTRTSGIKVADLAAQLKR